MAAGIFAILDDIAILLDDAAVMSKVAAKKTAGVLGDDLAVGAEKASGFPLHASFRSSGLLPKARLETNLSSFRLRSY